MTTSQKRCDYCNKPVEVVGRNEPEYRHLSGSVFCQTTVATVQGEKNPKGLTMTDPETPTVPKGWVAVPVSEVRAIIGDHVKMSGTTSIRTTITLSYPDNDARSEAWGSLLSMHARLPKPPAWTAEDVRIVRAAALEATGTESLHEAKAILAALAAAGRLRAPGDEA